MSDQTDHDLGDQEQQDGQRGHDDGGSILEDGGVDAEERAGRSQGIDTTSEPDEETKQEIEEERAERLDPDNRPEAAEVDNTQRDFDVEKGMFTDSDDYEESDEKPYAEDAGD